MSNPDIQQEAKAAWEEFDPGYSPYKGKADEMKTLFFAAYKVAAESRDQRIERLRVVASLAQFEFENAAGDAPIIHALDALQPGDLNA